MKRSPWLVTAPLMLFVLAACGDDSVGADAMVPFTGMGDAAAPATTGATTTGAPSTGGTASTSTTSAAGTTNGAGWPASSTNGTTMDPPGGTSNGTPPDAGVVADGGGADALAPDAHVPSDAGAAPQGCDRACLTQLMTDYLDALVAQDPSGLPLSADVRFTENGAELSLGEGLWSVAESLGPYRQDFAEVPAGQAAAFVSLEDSRGAVLLAVRLRVVDRAISEIETIVARRGEATFFAADDMEADPLLEADVDPADRLSRERLVEIADLYFQGLGRGDGSQVPFGASASRNENGVVTASGSSISNLRAFSYIEEIKRRYVLVDEERGIALPFVLFEIPDGLTGSRTLHLAELFKIVDEEIVRIVAIMVNQPLGTPSGWE